VGQLVAPVPSRRTAYLVGRRQLPAVLVVAGYLLLAVTLTWRLWADPAGRVPTDGGGVTNDIFLSTWFMRYAAIAVAHGRLPALASTALNAPQGVNVMWNTSLLLPAVVLAPVTMLAGPDASLTVMLTLGFAGSAATMFLVLRRWGAGLAAAAAGGALFGFSPALRQAAMYHYHLQFALLVPLIIDAVLLLVTGRGRPVRTGVWLGLLTVAQLLTAEEVLADIAVALIVILAVLAASRPRRLRSAIRPLSIGAAIAVAVVAVLGGYAIWTQFHGPLAASGIPWDTALYGNQPADFVTAPNAMLLHGSGFLRFTAGTGQRLSEYLGYLGWPLLVLVPVATIGCWRDLRVRTAGVTFIVLELLSIGGRTAPVGGLSLSPVLLPWHWLERLPVLSQMLPNRLSILGDAAAAAVLARAGGPAAPPLAARGRRGGRHRRRAAGTAAAPGRRRGRRRPRRLDGCHRPPGPAARRLDPAAADHAGRRDGLAGGHRRGRVHCRRLLHRADRRRQDRRVHRAARPDRRSGRGGSSHQPARGRAACWRRPAGGDGTVRAGQLAPDRGDHCGRPGVTTGPVPGAHPRPPDRPRWRGPGLADAAP
jgi:hypothetical protein